MGANGKSTRYVKVHDMGVHKRAMHTGVSLSLRSMHISFLFQIIRYITFMVRVWIRGPCTLESIHSIRTVHITFHFQIMRTRILAIIQFYSSIPSLNLGPPESQQPFPIVWCFPYRVNESTA